jgi:translation initiation factor 5
MFVDADGSPDGPAASLKLPTGLKRGAGLLRLLAGDAPGQLALLVALEWLCAEGPDAGARAKEAALALKTLYDEDLAEEDIILAWAGRADAAKALGVGPDGAASVRKAVAPVVEWLREGEEDSDDASDEEGDE